MIDIVGDYSLSISKAERFCVCMCVYDPHTRRYMHSLIFLDILSNVSHASGHECSDLELGASDEAAPTLKTSVYTVTLSSNVLTDPQFFLFCSRLLDVPLCVFPNPPDAFTASHPPRSCRCSSGLSHGHQSDPHEEHVRSAGEYRVSSIFLILWCQTPCRKNFIPDYPRFRNSGPQDNTHDSHFPLTGGLLLEQTIDIIRVLRKLGIDYPPDVRV